MRRKYRTCHQSSEGTGRMAIFQTPLCTTTRSGNRQRVQTDMHLARETQEKEATRKETCVRIRSYEHIERQKARANLSKATSAQLLFSLTTLKLSMQLVRVALCGRDQEKIVRSTVIRFSVPEAKQTMQRRISMSRRMSSVSFARCEGLRHLLPTTLGLQNKLCEARKTTKTATASAQRQ